MSLFDNLLKLHSSPVPAEDFFTEIVAFLFRSNEALLRAWLQNLGLNYAADSVQMVVDTQRRFVKLDHHDQMSRPDMVIDIYGVDFKDRVILESKWGASEGPDQLARYADHLVHQSDLRNRFLVYVTRGYDPKDDTEIVKRGVLPEVCFIQKRWYQFHQLLLTFNHDLFTQEAILFMENQRLTRNNRFQPTDLIALNSMVGVIDLMNETLNDEVEERFKAIVGGFSSARKSWQQLRHHRYLKYNYMGAQNPWWAGIGFFLTEEYPLVGLTIEVLPTAGPRPQIIEWMKSVAQRPDWQGLYLDGPDRYSRIMKRRPLSAFLGEEDHVYAVRQYLLELVEELRCLQQEFPHLPWPEHPDR